MEFQALPYTVRYDQENNVVLGEMFGALTAREYEDSYIEILESDVIPPDTNALWDLRNLYFSALDVDFVKSIVAVRKKYRHLRGNAKLAFLVDDEAKKKFMKLFSTMSEFGDTGQDMRAFYDQTEAINWLRTGQAD